MVFRSQSWLSPIQTALAMIVGGVVLFCWQMFCFEQSLQTQSWETTTGMITRSELRRTGRGGMGRKAELEYSYYVNGQLIENERIRFGGIDILPSHTLEKYPRGMEVDVYFDPENPSESVLEPNLPGSAYFLMFIACGLFAFGGAALFSTNPEVLSEM